MALISCPECNREVSDTAPACPGCGAAIADSRDLRSSGSRLVTTQETGKRLKMHALLSGAIFAIGVVLMVNAANAEESSSLGALSIVIGLGWFITTRVRIWWHHK